MLNPDVRHLLTDVLRPPTGWRLDAAVATTYTLDLSSLLLAPLSMAAYEQAEAGIESAAPHQLLEAIRRYAGRTTVFCQAGGIHVPTTYRKLTVFAEEAIIEVAPPPSRVFHPKIWVLRFTNASGDLTHRLACLSRNLTGDRSWDTVFMAEEDATAPHQMAAEPAAAFLKDLLTMSVRPVADARAALIRDLAATLSDRSLGVPPPFTSGTLYPMGTPGGMGWPVPASTDRCLVVSPFLDASTGRRIAGGSTIVSRAETFNRLGAAPLDGHELMVLQPYADAPPDVIADGQEAEGSGGTLEVKSGLHAKVFAWDVGGTGTLLAGSANATSAAFGGNIEFGVLLSGPVAHCGAAAILNDDDKETGLIRLLQPYKPSDEPVPDPAFDLERAIEEFHSALATNGPELHVTGDADAYNVQLEWASPPPQLGESWLRPITLKAAHDRRLGDHNGWRGLGLSDLTAFVAVRTRLERHGITVERSSALRATLVGAPADRARRVLRDLLSKIEDILRYLALLLQDPGIDDVASAILWGTHDEGAKHSADPHRWVDDLVLVEPLVHAFGRDDDSLDRVSSLLDDLRDEEGRLPDLGPDFDTLWRVVSAARETQ
ncbi:hypothetical protein Intca_3090 [Intrasporangium calvum DSM 43043]|uniref:PLD phosphodiesterase domain-containing protein n=1 Tax=Intrasporangium calvum (strain ATCC 23552 / DSM 43043 / JCM 3097 / NBRC 12989 / NCIMB 10167 / NRRL B-3866 / 7 KIP) TaxID=710696 RepID=E6SC36_INTC7|nr:hypothetical protein Intca_3090 [Intrasporangium calvum DSM 43043]